MACDKVIAFAPASIWKGWGPNAIAETAIGRFLAETLNMFSIRGVGNCLVPPRGTKPRENMLGFQRLSVGTVLRDRFWDRFETVQHYILCPCCAAEWYHDTTNIVDTVN